MFKYPWTVSNWWHRSTQSFVLAIQTLVVILQKKEINWVSSSCESLEVCSALSVISEVLIKKNAFDWWVNKLNMAEESTGYNKKSNTDKNFV